MKLPIKAPHAQAIKRFALQVLNITLAVWIALAFEGLVERRRIRELVATATVHMQNELRDNRRDVAELAKYTDQALPQVAGMLEFVSRLMAAHEARLAGKAPPSTDGSVSFNAMRALLNSSSHSSAEATGAFGHMPYADVKRFADAYGYQQSYQQTVDRMGELGSTVLWFTKLDMAKLSFEDLRELRTALAALRRTLSELASQTSTMLVLYDRALAGPPR